MSMSDSFQVTHSVSKLGLLVTSKLFVSFFHLKFVCRINNFEILKRNLASLTLTCQCLGASLVSVPVVLILVISLMTKAAEIANLGKWLFSCSHFPIKINTHWTSLNSIVSHLSYFEESQIGLYTS